MKNENFRGESGKPVRAESKRPEYVVKYPGVKDEYEDIVVLRDCVERYGMPLFKKGDVLWGKKWGVAPGCRGFCGWIVRKSTSDPYDYCLEEGVDAEKAVE